MDKRTFDDMMNQINLSVQDGLGYAEFQAQLKGYADGVQAAVNYALRMRQEQLAKSSVGSAVAHGSENRGADNAVKPNGKSHGSEVPSEAGN